MEILNTIWKVFLLQDTEAKKNIPTTIRFIVLCITTFFAYVMFKNLGMLSVKQLNIFWFTIISEPSLFMLGLFVLSYACFAIYFSIISIAFLNSLVPKT